VSLLFHSPGYDLLKKKSDALTFRFREITRKIKDAKEAMGEQMRATIFSVSEAVWAAGDFKCVFVPLSPSL
jgi:V-type H+-transporting ATPase subunit D